MFKLPIKTQFTKYYVNLRGVSFGRRKVLMLESDDWGAVRMPSGKIYDELTQACGKKGCFFDQFDSLETPDDLYALFEVLTSVKDANGNYAVFQPYAVVANPDYEAIEENGFRQYYYESFLDTYKRYPKTNDSFKAIKEGMDSGIWWPQSHSREHIQAQRWMKALQDPNSFARKEFYLRAFHSDCCPKDLDYYCACDYDSPNEMPELKRIMKDGLDLFENIYGYHSISFCAPCGFINQDMLDYLSELGIKLGSGTIRYPNFKGGYDVKNHFWGEKGKNGMIYYRRNCKFEPARDHNIDWVDRCMAEIENAFRCGKPAVIDSHRVNYIGGINESNRTDTLRQLARLLKEVVKRWPDVEFVNSNQLYQIMSK